jgi:hypothetical protein
MTAKNALKLFENKSRNNINQKRWMKTGKLLRKVAQLSEKPEGKLKPTSEKELFPH